MEPGRALGDFVVGERLGQGGFGVVYKAEQITLGREAVIKVLGHRGELAAQRFLREARLASRFDHPYAAHVYAFGAETDGTLWIAMELVRGQTLAELVRQSGALPPERFVPLFERLCEVVHSAHEQGIVHRDIKPANVMVLSRSGRLLPKLLDFGVAKAGLDEDGPGGEAPAGDPSLTQRGAHLGSPLYMAPEQWRDAAGAGPPADLYALGVLAWESLTGAPPYRGRDMVEMARLHTQGELPALGGALALFAPVLGRALAKRPAARYATALELAAAVRTAAGLDPREEALPRLPEDVRRVQASAPQPIAETMLALDGARTVHQAVEALNALVRIVLRWLAVLGLAASHRAGATDSARVVELIRTLGQRELDEAEWLALVLEHLGPFFADPERHPLPDLVRAVARAEPLLERAVARAEPGESAPASLEEKRRAELATRVPLVGELLRALDVLGDYLVVAGDPPVLWMGPRRTPRARPPGTPPAGELLVVDLEGNPLLQLRPLATIASPNPGAPPELFVLDGHGRHGARLVAPPIGFEREDEAVWDWLRAVVDASGDGSFAATEAALPYRGLAPFSAADTATFFGRERQAEALANRLRVEALVCVVGASGAGKTSLVHAGLLPRLELPVETLRPGAAPLAALEAALGRLDGAGLVVVDQLEELFTLAADPAEREAFAARLVEATGRHRVVLTLRDDFLARAAQLAAFRECLAASLELVTTPAPADLVRILVEPARRAGYVFEDPDLPAAMVREIADRPGALALLSFTAARLWERRDRQFHQLPTRAYEALGGVGGALARHAEEALGRMTAQEQRGAREAFRHLVTAEGTRAVLDRAELVQLTSGSVVEKLLAARLLVAGEDGRVEIIHEALLGAWPRLDEWRREDVAGARLRDQVRGAAKQWDERGRPRGLLWRGDALAELRVWRSRAALTDREAAFAAASLADEVRTTRRRLLIAGAVFVALSAAAVISFQLFRSARDRLTASYQDRGRQAFVDGDLMRAEVLLAEAWRLGARTPALDYLLPRVHTELGNQLAVLHHDDLSWGGAFSPDGQLVVTGSHDRTAAIWTRQGDLLHRLRGHEDAVLRVGFSPDGKRVFTGSLDRTTRIWSVETGREIARLVHGDRSYESAFSPDGESIASASWDRTVTLWDPDDGAVLRRWELGGRPEIVSFSHDGARILVGNNEGQVTLLDAAGTELPRVFAGHAGRPHNVRFGDGERLVFAAGGEAGAHVWQTASGELVATLRHGGTVVDGDITADGTLAVTGSSDGTAAIWSIPDGARQTTLLGQSGQIRAVRFAGPGLVATGAANGDATLWRVATGRPAARFLGHTVDIRSITIAPDGASLLTASTDRTLRLWRIAEPRLVWQTPVGQTAFHAEPISGRDEVLVVSDGRILRLRGGIVTQTIELGGANSLDVAEADGRVLVAFRDRNVAEIWDGGLEHRLVTLAGHEAPLTEAVFSSDGRHALTGSEDRTARLWDAADGRQLRVFTGHVDSVEAVAFGPMNETIATGSRDGVIRVMKSDGELLHELRGHTSFVQSVELARDGSFLLSAGEDAVAQIWDLDAGAPRVSLPHPVKLEDAAIDPTSRLVATVSIDGAARIWDVRSGGLLEELPHPGQIATVRWVDATRVVTAGRDGVIRMWDVGPRVVQWAEIEQDLLRRNSLEIIGESVVARHQ